MEALLGIVGEGFTPLLALFALAEDENAAFYLGAALFLAGPLFFGITYARYRNRGERHYHERETPVTLENLQSYDNFATRLTEQRSSLIAGANSGQVNGTLVKGGGIESMTDSLGSLLPDELGNQLKKLK
jgi:hypothetical protein